MDFFGSSDEEDEIVVHESTQVSSSLQAANRGSNPDVQTALFVQLVRIKPTIHAVAQPNYIKPVATTPEEAREIEARGPQVVTMHRRIGICISQDAVETIGAQFEKRLRDAKFEDVTVISWPLSPASPAVEPFDYVLFLSDNLTAAQSSDALAAIPPVHQPVLDSIAYSKVNNSYNSDGSLETLAGLWTLLRPGAHLIAYDENSTLTRALDDYLWVNSSTTHTPLPSSVGIAKRALLSVRRRAVLCNETGCLYWTNTTKRLANERAWIETISVPISAAEYRLGILTDESRQKAISALTDYGVVLLPGLMDPAASLQWGDVAKKDMIEVLEAVHKRDGLDLSQPAQYDQKGEIRRIENYHEVSMREALRCDVRNVRHMRQIVDDCKYTANEWPAYQPKDQRPEIECTDRKDLPPGQNIRFHPSVMSIVHESMNPPPAEEGDEEGNWGRWNFEGPGPGVPVSIRVGKPGVVMSMPGCADQTIHADASHLFVHKDLPPHYVNLFTCTTVGSTSLTTMQHTSAIPRDQLISEGLQTGADLVDGYLRGFAVGSTAFVVGSQKLRLCSHIMNEDGGAAELDQRLVRPQLGLGDALIFDTRALHFGLSNQTAEVLSKKRNIPVEQLSSEDLQEGWRGMLYVNYHHTWFHDPKNWNDAQKLFP